MPTRHFGHPPGVIPGTIFPHRMALMRAGVHRQLQAGISGSVDEGADSIIYTPAYEDNIDLGHTIFYPGEGGRSQETGRQVADQALTWRNRALLRSLETGLPVRVSRLVETAQGPQYRYDGLYRITDMAETIGVSGYKILLFTFKQIIHSG